MASIPSSGRGTGSRAHLLSVTLILLLLSLATASVGGSASPDRTSSVRGQQPPSLLTTASASPLLTPRYLKEEDKDKDDEEEDEKEEPQCASQWSKAQNCGSSDKDDAKGCCPGHDCVVDGEWCVEVTTEPALDPTDPPTAEEDDDEDEDGGWQAPSALTDEEDEDDEDEEADSPTSSPVDQQQQQRPSVPAPTPTPPPSPATSKPKPAPATLLPAGGPTVTYTPGSPAGTAFLPLTPTTLTLTFPPTTASSSIRSNLDVDLIAEVTEQYVLSGLVGELRGKMASGVEVVDVELDAVGEVEFANFVLEEDGQTAAAGADDGGGAAGGGNPGGGSSVGGPGGGPGGGVGEDDGQDGQAAAAAAAANAVPGGPSGGGAAVGGPGGGVGEPEDSADDKDIFDNNIEDGRESVIDEGEEEDEDDEERFNGRRRLLRTRSKGALMLRAELRAQISTQLQQQQQQSSFASASSSSSSSSRLLQSSDPAPTVTLTLTGTAKFRIPSSLIAVDPNTDQAELISGGTTTIGTASTLPSPALLADSQTSIMKDDGNGNNGGGEGVSEGYLELLRETAAQQQAAATSSGTGGNVLQDVVGGDVLFLYYAVGGDDSGGGGGGGAAPEDDGSAGAGSDGGAAGSGGGGGDTGGGSNVGGAGPNQPTAAPNLPPDNNDNPSTAATDDSGNNGGGSSSTVVTVVAVLVVLVVAVGLFSVYVVRKRSAERIRKSEQIVDQNRREAKESKRKKREGDGGSRLDLKLSGDGDGDGGSSLAGGGGGDSVISGFSGLTLESYVPSGGKGANAAGGAAANGGSNGRGVDASSPSREGNMGGKAWSTRFLPRYLSPGKASRNSNGSSGAAAAAGAGNAAGGGESVDDNSVMSAASSLSFAGSIASLRSRIRSGLSASQRGGRGSANGGGPGGGGEQDLDDFSVGAESIGGMAEAPAFTGDDTALGPMDNDDEQSDAELDLNGGYGMRRVETEQSQKSAGGFSFTSFGLGGLGLAAAGVANRSDKNDDDVGSLTDEGSDLNGSAAVGGGEEEGDGAGLEVTLVGGVAPSSLDDDLEFGTNTRILSDDGTVTSGGYGDADATFDREFNRTNSDLSSRLGGQRQGQGQGGRASLRQQASARTFVTQLSPVKQGVNESFGADSPSIGGSPPPPPPAMLPVMPSDDSPVGSVVTKLMGRFGSSSPSNIPDEGGKSGGSSSLPKYRNSRRNVTTDAALTPNRVKQTQDDDYDLVGAGAKAGSKSKSPSYRNLRRKGSREAQQPSSPKVGRSNKQTHQQQQQQEEEKKQPQSPNTRTLLKAVASNDSNEVWTTPAVEDSGSLKTASATTVATSATASTSTASSSVNRGSEAMDDVQMRRMEARLKMKRQMEYDADGPSPRAVAPSDGAKSPIVGSPDSRAYARTTSPHYISDDDDDDDDCDSQASEASSVLDELNNLSEFLKDRRAAKKMMGGGGQGSSSHGNQRTLQTTGSDGSYNSKASQRATPVMGSSSIKPASVLSYMSGRNSATGTLPPSRGADPDRDMGGGVGGLHEDQTTTIRRFAA